MRQTMKTFLLGVTAIFIFIALAYGQDQKQGPQYQKQESGVPVLTGFVGFGSEFVPGQQTLEPTISPILLIPIGDHFLFETEGEFEGSYDHMTGQPWDHHWDKGIEYIQGNIFVNKYLTLVGGRFLTP